MTSIGPFSIRVVIVFVAACVAWCVARAAARRLAPEVPHRAAGSLILDALLVGLVAARLAYMAQWWREYVAAPLSMLAIGDGGYTGWAGILAALAFIGWRTAAQRHLRRPVLIGVVAGVVTWAGAGAVLALQQRSAPPLPDMALMTLDAQPVDLAAYRGRPVVVNLWASWCPPCRREMPAFEQAQRAFPEVAFVLINQGESAQQARTFLDQEGLALTDVLLDPDSQAMKALRARGMPTTFFFDAQGRLVHAHMGELTMAALSGTLARRLDVAARGRQAQPDQKQD